MPPRRTPLRSRAPLPSMSKRRRGELRLRAVVRAEVLGRDGGCVARDLLPEIACWHPYGDPLDVHEYMRRTHAPGDWLIPDRCVALCRAHHDYLDAESDRGVVVGLVRRSWDTPS
jgi:hypothetical protein